MITREQLKTNAKSVLSHTYWMSLASNFIISTVLSAISSAVMIATYLIATLLQMAMGLSVGLITQNETATIIAMMFSPGGLIIYAGAIALAVFASNPAQVGLQYFYIRSRNTLNPDIGDIIKPLKTNYKNIVKVMFMMFIRVWLWSLLFVIPGIIKSLEYWMVSYIVAENPNIDHKRALEISSKTMEGEKAFCFVLGLSFIGWILLCMATCGAGSIFLTPYISATFTEYYMYLKTKAVSLGYAEAAEFTEGSSPAVPASPADPAPATV